MVAQLLAVDIFNQRIARLVLVFRELLLLPVTETPVLEEQTVQLTERGCFLQPKRELSCPRSVMKI
jgi:hypothetical protein